MTKQESEALLVLAPGVFLRAGVHCPHCRRRMQAEPKWRARDTLIDWQYVCESCGTVLDASMKIIRSLKVWSLDYDE